MLSASKIKSLFKALNEELRSSNIKGEIGICGGSVMCLVFKTRSSTKDVDAIFEPTREIRLAAKRIAEKYHLADDWLNDAAKGFFAKDPPKQDVMSLSHLRIWAPRADYMLAMKCVAARYDSSDKDDVLFLIKHLGLVDLQSAIGIIETYYPRNQVPPKTQFFLEEIFTSPNKKSDSLSSPE